MAKFYLVGGMVRDKIMNISSNDYDYSVVCGSYEAMREAILKRGGAIFLETPEYFTIRASVPGLGVCDYVLCRKDGAYSDGRHPDHVVHGTLHDDLSRRDFTVNAIAKDEDGNYIDPFNGIQDINDGFLRCVGDAKKRFQEDYLRMLRAIRFHITKGFDLDPEIEELLHNHHFCFKLAETVSVERVKDELMKCFKFNTVETLDVLDEFRLLRDHLLGMPGLWLMPTMKGK